MGPGGGHALVRAVARACTAGTHGVAAHCSGQSWAGEGSAGGAGPPPPCSLFVEDNLMKEWVPAARCAGAGERDAGAPAGRTPGLGADTGCAAGAPGHRPGWGGRLWRDSLSPTPSCSVPVCSSFAMCSTGSVPFQRYQQCPRLSSQHLRSRPPPQALAGAEAAYARAMEAASKVSLVGEGDGPSLRGAMEGLPDLPMMLGAAHSQVGRHGRGNGGRAGSMDWCARVGACVCVGGGGGGGPCWRV